MIIQQYRMEFIHNKFSELIINIKSIILLSIVIILILVSENVFYLLADINYENKNHRGKNLKFGIVAQSHNYCQWLMII